jgi:gamma-glutamyltranspeptidase/glutathione hydrolase
MRTPDVPGFRRIARRSIARLTVGVLLTVPALAAYPPAARGENGMVVTPDVRATESGVAILKAGGNACDAAVAVAFALAVTFPQAGNLGGGGFLLYRTETGNHEALDFRERAPAALRAEMFLDDDGRPIEKLSTSGGLSVGVPGSVAGLAEFHRKHCTLPWADLLAPAIRLASDGFEISPYLARSLERHATKLGADPESARLFLPGGSPLAAGTVLVQSDLAVSLTAIAEGGPAAFHDGPLGASLSAAVREAGGVMTPGDLRSYRAIWRRPLEGRYRGYRVVTFPPPSGGGVALLQILAMLERYDLSASGPASSLTTHLIAEAARRAYADRSRWLGDPDHYAVPFRNLLDRVYLDRRAASIRPKRATPSRKLQPGTPAGAESPDTLHFSVADSAGRAVALTTTLNASFGNGMIAPGTGILLNNEIDDFALAPGVPNTYGLLGGAANGVAGGKRPLSSMTPTFVELPSGGPRPALVLGSPGGSTIITAVLQVLINTIDHRMPLQEAVNAPRIHHQWQPDEIRHERRALAQDVRRNLESRGHVLTPTDGPLGNVNAIGLAADGAWLGAADSRRIGSAEGF